jgi:hypothetical protein
MIRNEADFKEASKRFGDKWKRLDEHRARVKAKLILKRIASVEHETVSALT